MQMLVELVLDIMLTVVVALAAAVAVAVVLEPQHHLDLDLLGIPEKAVMIIFGQVFHPR